MYKRTDQTRYLSLKGQGDGKLDLALAGFGHQALIPIEDLVSFVLTVPTRHLTGIRAICYQPEGYSLYPAFSRSNRCLGEFIQETGRILIYKVQSREILLHVLGHEIGHHVFLKILKPTDRREWTNIFAQYKSSVSDYGKQSFDEDFAESYAFYLTHPTRLERLPAKFNFMRHKVFRQ